MLTFKEITERRIALQLEQDGRSKLCIESPEWLQSYLKYLSENYYDGGGVIYQKCGGGRRIIRKSIGGD